MNIHKIHDLSDSFSRKILETGLSEIREKYLIENYSPEYRQINSNLFYILDNGRYSEGNGAYYIIEDNNNFIAGSGWNKYDDETAIVLSRSYIKPEYRTEYLMGKYLLPLMLSDCSGFEKVWITCNKYNKAIYNWFCRAHSGKSPAMFKNWPDIYKKFEPIGIKTVYFTEQYVAQLKR